MICTLVHTRISARNSHQSYLQDQPVKSFVRDQYVAAAAEDKHRQIIVVSKIEALDYLFLSLDSGKKARVPADLQRRKLCTGHIHLEVERFFHK